MAFFFEYISGMWDAGSAKSDRADRENWEAFLKSTNEDRQRDRIVLWRDRVTTDDYAVNSEEPEFYRRSSGFVWRFKDTTGINKAQNHQYAYNLAKYGHRQVTRRDESDLKAAASAVQKRVESGELGPISPLA